jgi:hypothetical protein
MAIASDTLWHVDCPGYTWQLDHKTVGPLAGVSSLSCRDCEAREAMSGEEDGLVAVL